MTVNNYTISQIPWNNPFNSRVYGNYNPQRTYIDRSTPSSQLHVPQNRGMFMQNTSNVCHEELHVPCQNQIPMGCESKAMLMMDENVMELPDGTVIDMRSRKVIRKPSESFRMNNPFEDNHETEEWSDNPLEGMCVQNNRDIQYQQMCAKKDAEIKRNLSNERKELMRELMNGELIGDFDTGYGDDF